MPEQKPAVDIVEFTDALDRSGIIVLPTLHVAIVKDGRGLRMRLDPDEARFVAIKLIEVAGKLEDLARDLDREMMDRPAGNA